MGKKYEIENTFYSTYWLELNNMLNFNKLYHIDTDFGEVQFTILNDKGRATLDNIKIDLPYKDLSEPNARKIFDLVWDDIVDKFELATSHS